MEAVGQGVGNRIESAREGSFPGQCQSSNQEPVSNPSMRVFALRRPVAFLALLFVTILAGAKTTSHMEQAVSMLHEQETWLAANRAEIQTKIAEGYASAQRGELIGPDEVRAKLAEVKRARSNR